MHPQKTSHASILWFGASGSLAAATRFYDAHQTSEVLLALSRDSHEEVDAITQAAAAAGGKADIREPQDMGNMYFSALSRTRTAMCSSQCAGCFITTTKQGRRNRPAASHAEEGKRGTASRPAPASKPVKSGYLSVNGVN